ncbi:uncharacterized protein LOC129915623 [Episyrphus balteatus]|uniref:uncharacterized protein LOC129915623 n=1 Tax=Episyrphus balteatus TaxID=286459 RepID=UPI002486B1B3|nr:uncharacterized protein LOC129915623 [Episyrphus balteatus]
MWENPSCQPSATTCPQVRFDALYYKPSDKAIREYQQTWIECPARLIKPSVSCKFPQDKYPPLERRPRRARPDTAKCMDSSKLKLASCSRQKDLKQNASCLKIIMPGCRGVRQDIRCKLVREPANCKIIANPYPSYSECNHPKSKSKPPNECECMKIRSMCDIWTILRKKQIL